MYARVCVYVCVGIMESVTAYVYMYISKYRYNIENYYSILTRTHAIKRTYAQTPTQYYIPPKKDEHIQGAIGAHI